MTEKYEKPEILAPAGNMEKLKTAIHFGADALYLGGKEFSLRQRAGNFDLDELKEALTYAHKHGVKVYLTLNAFPDNAMMERLREYVQQIAHLPLDAVIVADPGVALLWREYLPHIDLHISTQANTMNAEAVQFWEQFGASRVCLARELSLEEIIQIRRRCPDMELEAFVHGAMCISYSGRCLMGKYMTNRDGNQGDCPQSCRWRYYLVEEKREGEFYPIEFEAQGASLFNSRDMCTIAIIPQLIEAGIDSFKIEGRMKSVYYLGVCVSTYRQARDSYYGEKAETSVDEWTEELESFSHRPYFPGFYLDKEAESTILFGSINVRKKDIIAPVDKVEVRENNTYATVTLKTKILKGDTLELFTPEAISRSFVVEEMYDLKRKEFRNVAQPNDRIRLQVPSDTRVMDIIRKECVSE